MISHLSRLAAHQGSIKSARCNPWEGLASKRLMKLVLHCILLGGHHRVRWVLWKAVREWEAHLSHLAECHLLLNCVKLWEA